MLVAGRVVTRTGVVRSWVETDGDRIAAVGEVPRQALPARRAGRSLPDSSISTSTAAAGTASPAIPTRSSVAMRFISAMGR